MDGGLTVLQVMALSAGCFVAAFIVVGFAGMFRFLKGSHLDREQDRYAKPPSNHKDDAA